MLNRKLFLFLDQLVVSASNFLIGILLVRSFGLEAFGEFSFYWLAALFISGIIFSYISSPLLTYYYRKARKARLLYLKYAFVNVIFIYLILLILGFLLAVLLDNVSFTGVFFVLCYVIYDYSRKVKILLDKYYNLVILDVLIYSTTLGLLVFMPEIGMYDFLTALGFGFLLFFISEVRLPLYFSSLYLNRFLGSQHKNGKWLLINTFTQWFNEPYYFSTAGIFFGASTLGGIRVVQNLFGLCNVFLVFFETYLPIKLSRTSYNLRHIEYKKLLISFVFLGLLSCLAVLCFSYFYSKELILYIYNVYDENTFIYIALYSVSYVLIFVCMVFRVILRNEGATKEIFYSFLSASIFNISLSVPLLYYFNEQGAVIGICLGWILITVFMYAKIKRIIFK